MKILIVGAGKTGAFLAERLQCEHEVTVIEQRRTHVEHLRAMVPEIEVIEGDACEPDVLETAGVEGTDLVVAATGDDEDNLVVAMLAKIYRVEKVVARVNHPSNEWLYDKEWGVDAAMSSPAVLHGLIEKDLGLGDLITLLKLQTDGVAVEEITLPATAAAVGRRIDGVSLPSNVTIMAILSADRGVQAARDEYVLSASDQLLLLVEGALEGAEIRESFGIAEP